MKPNVKGISDTTIAVGVEKIKIEYVAFCKEKGRARLWNSFSLLT